MDDLWSDIWDPMWTQAAGDIRPLLTTVSINGAEIDPGSIFLPMRISHGRSDSNNQPDAPELTFDYAGPVPPAAIGDSITVTNVVRWNGPRHRRFTGEVIGLNAVEDDGQIIYWSVRALGAISNLGFIPLRVERPEETDVERVLALAAEAKVRINIKGDPSLKLAADNVDRDLLSAVQEICASTGGLFWQSRDGGFWYGTGNHRSGTTNYTLPAAAILDGVDWVKSTNDLINHIEAIWPAPKLKPIQHTGEWTWDPATDTGVDPGNGDVRTNDADSCNQMTQMVVSQLTNTGVDVSLIIRRLKEGARVYIQEKDDADRWALWHLLNAAEDNGVWFTLAIDFKEASEKGEPRNGRAVFITFDGRQQEQTNSKLFMDDDSIARWGIRHVQAETLCADTDEARLLALTILSRRAEPYWQMPGVMVPFLDLSLPDRLTMMQLEVSTGVLAPVSRDPGPTPSRLAQWAVEGWVEEWSDEGYWFQLSMTDWSRSSSASIRAWAALRDTMTWATVATKNYQDLLTEVT